MNLATDRGQAFSPDLQYQLQALDGVSRTFALTIPALAPRLRRAVGNAYLLCRIADTIEDEPALSAAEKHAFAQQFVDAVAGRLSAAVFARSLAPRLSAATSDAERDLVRNSERVLRVKQQLGERQQAAIERCVAIMAQGMVAFQEKSDGTGLADMRQLDDYCYHVAGVVGEMLTELFCEHSAQIDRRRDALLALAASFGEGLQLTNILKDFWEDRRRGACWLPRAVFARHGFDLADLPGGHRSREFGAGLGELVGVARGHLERALDYTLMIPADETGIRRFCLWALGMALLTLRKLHWNRAYESGAQVKISRLSVKATLLAAGAGARHDRILRFLFSAAARPLPVTHAR